MSGNAASIPHGVLSTNPIHVQQRAESLSSSSFFSVTERVIRANAKNVLRTIRQSFEWLGIFFASIKDNVGIGKLIIFTTTGEKAFVFSDVARSVMKVCHNFTSFVKVGVAKTISSFAENTLDLVWNFFKFFKALKGFEIFSLTSKILIPLQAFGGAAFAINSTRRIYAQVEKGPELLNNINNHLSQPLEARQKNDAAALASIFSTAKNICTLGIGLLVTLGAINGYVAPMLVYLTLGTVILITEITSSILKESYKLEM